jgi:hypothetical protein
MAMTTHAATQRSDAVRGHTATLRFERLEHAHGVQATFQQAGAYHTLTGEYLMCAVPFSVQKNIEVAPAISVEKQRVGATSRGSLHSGPVPIRPLSQVYERFHSEESSCRQRASAPFLRPTSDGGHPSREGWLANRSSFRCGEVQRRLAQKLGQRYGGQPRPAFMSGGWWA